MTFRPVVSRQIIITTYVANAILLVGAILVLVLGYNFRARGPASYVLFFTGGLNLLLLIGSSAFRIRAYEIVANDLVIRLGFGSKKISLTGLQDARTVERPFAGARRDMGIGGLWSMYGRFSNRESGAFSAYTATTETGVLLTWAGKKVLVAPDDPARFLQSVRAAQ